MEIPETSTFPILCVLLAERPSRLSQAMHNAGYVALGLPFVYVAVHVRETAKGIEALRTLGIRGASLTIPHKEAACALVDTISDEARRIGAINTIVQRQRADGSWELFGENTDWLGIVQALDESSEPIANDTAVVVGAGGAARAGVHALQRRGMRRIVVVNRSPERAAALAKDFGVEAMPLTELGRSLGEVSLLMNATPAGSKLGGLDAFCLEPALLAELAPRAVFDMVTKETPTTRWAADSGRTVIPGARMLLFQALAQFQLFTGAVPPREAMEAALNRELDLI